ncbi:hypothetical protein Bca52824_072518 [Brassica carinata]|uniref:Uncharacterized protein n=1 Tax=Brassica carinata TaxID=52824 RepID=A0A8X7U511_BRACI|nr:hypothetical protein Bca52824_072518 [Brassica carinata]
MDQEGYPIAKEEAEDDHIRPAYPLFNSDLLFDYEKYGVSATDDSNETVRPRLRKLFVEDRDGDGDGKSAEEGSKLDPLGPYCSWSDGTVAEASPETCRTPRDSRLWSNVSGGDKAQSSSSSAAAKLTSEDDKKQMEAENKSAKGKEETTSSRKRTKSAHEKLYMRNRAMKEEGKHRL